VHFNLEIDKLLEAISSMAETANLDCTNPPNRNGGNRQSITENTSETTAEKKPKHTASPSAQPSRGSRLPEGFDVTPGIRLFATENSLPDPNSVIDEFKDYWRAQPGSRGVKLDWNATFRNWLRRSAQFAAKSRKPAARTLREMDYRDEYQEAR
jgi:hypothetical protein